MKVTLKIKQKIILMFLLIGLIPLVIVGWWGSRQSEDALMQKSYDQLIAVREIKASSVESYFQNIENQIITFSEDKMIVDAMGQFKDFFKTFRSEGEIGPSKLESMQQKLSSYYTGEFSTEYRNQNDGEAPNITSILRKLDADSVALQYYYIKANKNRLGSKHLLDKADDGSEYSRLHGEVHPIVRNFLEKFGYYDIFLVDSETGDIVYSVFKELDFGTSLIDGPYADSNFGEAFRKANSMRDKDAAVLVDYKKYTPSYEAPASFMASPIFDGDKKIGVLIFQMPIDRLNEIMMQRAGLGDTGETYLVGKDKLMRSDSYLDPENHSVVASFKNTEKGSADTEAIRDALSGKSDTKIIIDYNGNPVLSAYAPVKIGDNTWALLSEIDEAEVLKPVKALANSIIIAGVVLALLVAIIAVFVAISFASPLLQCVDFAKKVAEGDLTSKLDLKRGDEIGELIGSLNEMSSSLRNVVREIMDSSNNIATASEEISSTTEELAAGADSQTKQTEDAASAIEELAASIQKNFENTKRSLEISEETSSTASKGGEIVTKTINGMKNIENVVGGTSEKMNNLGERSKEIGKIVEVIKGIATQTNLLALNAAIEANRAGEHGRGFEVVAEEIRKLAEKSAESTVQIAEIIEEIQNETTSAVESISGVTQEVEEGVKFSNETGDALKKIIEQISNTLKSINLVTDASQEQASVSDEVAKSMENISTTVKESAASAEELAQTSQELARLGDNLQKMMGQFKI